MRGEKLMSSNYMTLKFKSSPQNEKLARRVIAAFAAELNPTVDEICDIKTAVSEAVTNAIVHGYRNKEGTVTLNACYNGATIEISVCDNGVGIENIQKAREPLFTTQPELERSGMGFTVMETFMDYLDVISSVNEGTKVIMRKTIGAFNESN